MALGGRTCSGLKGSEPSCRYSAANSLPGCETGNSLELMPAAEGEAINRF